MTTPKYNKFNTGKTKGYFPLKRWRFNTEEHPVIQSKQKCASSTAKTPFSTQELQMLVGLTNTLQCKERDAVRIALYEAVRSASEAYELAFRYADSKATDKAHQGRSSAKQWKLPKQEKDESEKAAKELGITNQEFLRLAIIWLQRGIRDDNNGIKNLANSKLIPFDTTAKEWSRENQGKPPSAAVAKLKKARDIAYEEAGERNRRINKEKWDARKAYLLENGFVIPPDEDGRFSDFSSIDALIEIQEADNFQRIVQDEIDKLRLVEREAFDYKWKEIIPELTKNELDFIWNQELAEAKELAETEETIDELMEEVEAMCQELRDLMTPEEKVEEQRNRKEREERLARKHSRPKHKPDPFEIRLKRRLDELFDGHG